MNNPLEALFPHPNAEEQQKAEMLFANRLAEAMKLRKMSAANLSRLTGINPSMISQYKRGQYHPKQEKLETMAKALEVCPHWLLGSSDDIEGKLFAGFQNIITLTNSEIPQLNPFGELCLEEPMAEYFVGDGEKIPNLSLKITDENMANAGINTGDIIFLDTTASTINNTIKNGDIIAVSLENDIVLKRIFFTDTTIQLCSENSKTPTLIFETTKEINIIGKATTVQKKLN